METVKARSGNVYTLLKTEMRKDVAGGKLGNKMTRKQLARVLGKRLRTARVGCTCGTCGPYTVNTRFSKRSRSFSIGCETFTGKNAEKLYKWAGVK